jgi:plastocyanin
MGGVRLAVTLATVALVAPGAAAADTVDVGANGNPFTGGLSFTPAEVSIRVGDSVRWTNTDVLVPHTATEDHGLFVLTGTYGGTPLNPPGFGPGESRERRFEAGTFSYFCELHPDQMRGVISAAPTVKRFERRGKRKLRVTWAPAPPDSGLVFDVERRIGGAWQTVRDGTMKPAGTFRGTRGRFRARLRSAEDPTAASEFSPAGKPGRSPDPMPVDQPPAADDGPY